MYVYYICIIKEFTINIYLSTLSRPRIGLESLLEHFIFLNVLGGGPPNPPQGELATHRYSHHKILNPPFTDPLHPCYNCYVTV